MTGFRRRLPPGSFRSPGRPVGCRPLTEEIRPIRSPFPSGKVRMGLFLFVTRFPVPCFQRTRPHHPPYRPIRTVVVVRPYEIGHLFSFFFTSWLSSLFTDMDRDVFDARTVCKYVGECPFLCPPFHRLNLNGSLDCPVREGRLGNCIMRRVMYSRFLVVTPV